MYALEYPETVAVPGGSSRYTENVMSNMELRPPLFPSSVCMGSNGYDNHFIPLKTKIADSKI